MNTNKNSRTTYKSADAKEKVWNKATKIDGKDSALYRKDPYGKEIFYNSYGKDSSMGWNIDHITPVQKGGSDDISNLQALQTHINKSKGDTLVKKSRHSNTNK